MELQEIANSPAKRYEGVVRNLLRIDDKDVSLKTIFDHVRSYLICAAIIDGAELLAKSDLPVHSVLAVLLCLLGIALMALNFGQGLVLASAIGIRRWAGVAFGLLMFLIMGDFSVLLNN